MWQCWKSWRSEAVLRLMSHQARFPKTRETQLWNKPILRENRVRLFAGRGSLAFFPAGTLRKLADWTGKGLEVHAVTGPSQVKEPRPGRMPCAAVGTPSHLPQRQGLRECRFNARCVERILGWKLPSSLEKSCCGIPQATVGAGPIFLYRVTKISQVCTSLANLNLNKNGGLLKLQWHYETSPQRFLRPFLSPGHFLPDWRRCHFQSFLLLLKECQVEALGISPFPFVTPEPAREVQCRNWRFKWSHYRGVRLCLPPGRSAAVCESSGARITEGREDVASRLPGFKLWLDILSCVTLVE